MCQNLTLKILKRSIHGNGEVLAEDKALEFTQFLIGSERLPFHLASQVRASRKREKMWWGGARSAALVPLWQRAPLVSVLAVDQGRPEDTSLHQAGGDALAPLKQRTRAHPCRDAFSSSAHHTPSQRKTAQHRRNGRTHA